MLGISLAITDRRTGTVAQTLQLSSTSIAEDASSGTTVGTLSVVNHPSGSSGWTFTETADPDSKFAISGANLNTSAALDYETSQSHSVTITASKSGQDDIVRVFSISVTNVLEVTLSALDLSDDDIPPDEAATINITGATSGSTISVLSGSLPAGMTLNSGARTISGTPTVTETANFTLRETHPDAAPRDTELTIGVTLPLSGYDVIVLAGQSNMVGRYGPVDGTLDATDADILEYGYNSETVALAQDPLDHRDETANTVGMGMSFAKAYKASILAPGRKILLVPVAQGNTSFSGGFWAEDGSGDTGAIARANAAMAEGDGVNQLAAILWHQGESDGSLDEEEYAAELDALITRWRTDITDGDPTTPFIVGDLRSDQPNAGVRAALQNTPLRMAHTAWASSSGLTVGADGTHFTAASQRTFGLVYFDKFDDAQANDLALAISGDPVDATVGTSVIFEPTIIGGATPYASLTVVSGSLPPGRSITGLTVTGEYTTDGSYSYTLRVTDALGATDDLAVDETVSAVSSYEAQGVTFDGTSDYLSRGAALTDVVAGKQGTLSFWVRFNGGDDSTVMIFGRNTTSGLHMQRFYQGSSLGAAIDLKGYASSSNVLRLTTEEGYTVADGWVHVLAAWDLATGYAEMYIDGAADSDPGRKIATSGDISYNVPDLGIGAQSGGSSKINADLADFYLNTTTCIDITVLANRQKFILGGVPVDLGSDGSNPTGSAPAVFLSGAVDTWHVNKGTGGGFTENGALTAAADNP